MTTQTMIDWLKPLSTKLRKTSRLLDGFDPEFYLRFDCAEDPENPAATGTCDIHIVPVGELPTEGLRVVCNANRYHVLRFLFALGVSRFPEHIRKAMYDMNSPICRSAERQTR